MTRTAVLLSLHKIMAVALEPLQFAEILIRQLMLLSWNFDFEMAMNWLQNTTGDWFLPNWLDVWDEEEGLSNKDKGGLQHPLGSL